MAEQKAKELVSDLEKMDVKAVAFQADLSDYDNVRRLHADIVNTLGNPDILFNNAGVLNGVIGPNGNIQDVSVERFEETWRTNTGTAYLVGDNRKRTEVNVTKRVTVNAVMLTQYGEQQMGPHCIQLKVSMIG
jgi:3-oxoacyl-[acyl-carrier protein] reductase